MLKIALSTSRLIVALLVIFPATLTAQTYTSSADWTAATCGQIVEDEIVERITEYLIANNLDPNQDYGALALPMPTDLGWGGFTSFGYGANAFFNFVSVGRLGFVIDEQQLDGTGEVERTFYLDPDPALGPVEGFCFHYGSAGFNIDIYDGATLVESLHAPSSGPTDFADFGWINVDGLNVTRIEIYSVPDVPMGNPVTFISSIDFSFGVYCPPADSPYDQLTGVRDDIATLLADASGRDAVYLNRALTALNQMQNGFLWQDDNRLTRFGGRLFVAAGFAVAFLERTSDPQADAIIDDLMSALATIVDTEIAYAIDNGGDGDLIAQAEYFAQLARIIDNDYDNQVIATRAYRLAWSSAYNSTD